MTSSNSSVGRTESLAVTIPPPSSGVSMEPTVSSLSAQLANLTAMITELTNRRDGSEFRPSDAQALARPPPAPPFNTAYATTATYAMPVFMYTPTSSPPIHSATHAMPPVSAGFLQSLGSSRHSGSQPFGFTEAGGLLHQSVTLPRSVAQQWRSPLPDQRQFDRPPFTQPPIVSASSCWGPPRQIEHSGVVPTDHARPKVKLEPPRFDGTEVNNWIRGVQFYFDHIGTPEAHRLHYVVMLFEPSVADWIWNYCASHEFVTWYEFLDDVRR